MRPVKTQALCHLWPFLLPYHGNAPFYSQWEGHIGRHSSTLPLSPLHASQPGMPKAVAAAGVAAAAGVRRPLIPLLGRCSLSTASLVSQLRFELLSIGGPMTSSYRGAS